MGSGPPSGAGTLGTEAAAYVPTKANIRTSALTERFMGFSPSKTASLLSGGSRAHYTGCAKIHTFPYKDYPTPGARSEVSDDLIVTLVTYYSSSTYQ